MCAGTTAGDLRRVVVSCQVPVCKRAHVASMVDTFHAVGENNLYRGVVVWYTGNRVADIFFSQRLSPAFIGPGIGLACRFFVSFSMVRWHGNQKNCGLAAGRRLARVPTRVSRILDPGRFSRRTQRAPDRSVCRSQWGLNRWGASC